MGNLASHLLSDLLFGEYAPRKDSSNPAEDEGLQNDEVEEEEKGGEEIEEKVGEAEFEVPDVAAHEEVEQDPLLDVGSNVSNAEPLNLLGGAPSSPAHEAPVNSPTPPGGAAAEEEDNQQGRDLQTLLESL